VVALLKKSEEIKKKTNLNTIEHSKSIFNGHYILKWMRHYLNLKLLKRTGVKEITSFTSLQEEK
jgi:hypothetical protein